MAKSIGSTNDVTIYPFPMVNAALGGIGGQAGRIPRHESMDVENFRIYNRALSSNEVAQLYAYESTRCNATPASIANPQAKPSIKAVR